MPSYLCTAGEVVVLPDAGLTVSPGDTVDLPDGFFVDDVQAVGCGFTLTTKSSKKTAEVPVEPAPTEPAPTEPPADPAPAAN